MAPSPAELLSARVAEARAHPVRLWLRECVQSAGALALTVLAFDAWMPGLTVYGRQEPGSRIQWVLLTAALLAGGRVWWWRQPVHDPPNVRTGGTT